MCTYPKKPAHSEDTLSFVICQKQMLSDFVLLQFLQRPPRNSSAESRNGRAVHTTVTRFVSGNENTVTLHQKMEISAKRNKLDSLQISTDALTEYSCL